MTLLRLVLRGFFFGVDVSVVEGEGEGDGEGEIGDVAGLRSSEGSISSFKCRLGMSRTDLRNSKRKQYVLEYE